MVAWEVCQTDRIVPWRGARSLTDVMHVSTRGVGGGGGNRAGAACDTAAAPR